VIVLPSVHCYVYILIQATLEIQARSLTQLYQRKPELPFKDLWYYVLSITENRTQHLTQPK